MESRDIVIVGLMFLVIILFSSIFYIVFLENDDIESAPINNTTNEEVNTSIQEIEEEVQVPKAEQPSAYGNVAVDFTEANSNLAHTPEYAAREMFNICDENGDGLLTGQEYDDWRYMVANSEFARNAHNH